MMVSKTQKRYAKVLSWVAAIGQLLVVVGYIIYLSKLLPMETPIERITQAWHLSAAEFTDELGIETGWNWLRKLSHGDIISYGAIVLLALGTNVSLLVAAVSFLQEKNGKYTLIVILQLVVLLIAASGIVSGVGH
jgi:uncharacterized membrane protein